MEFYFQVFFQKLIEYHQRKICTYGNDNKIMNAPKKITAFVVTFIFRKGKLFFVDY